MDDIDSWLWPVLLAALGIGAVGEYVVKKTKGTWTPYRRRPYPYTERTRIMGLAGMALCLLGSIAAIVYGFANDDRESVVNGALLAPVFAWIVWIGSRMGRDVSDEERDATKWKRPANSYWQFWSNAALAVAVVLGGAFYVVVGEEHRLIVLASCLAGGALLGGIAVASTRMRVQDDG
jgi:hypothetical protein